MTRPRLEEKLSNASSLTLGKLIRELETKVSHDLFCRLLGASEKRNYLAHRFWFEQASLMTTETGIGEMIEMLEAMTDLFGKLDSEVEKLVVGKLHDIGVTNEDLQESFERVLKDEDSQQTLHQRKLRRQERIIQAWQFRSADGSRALMFETQDGCLWQLCDVGLGWTFHERPGKDWQVDEQIARFLPANTNPRPEIHEPWSYDLQLGNKATILVRPERKMGSYQLRLCESPERRT